MLLETPRLLLREQTLEDAEATNAYERDPDVVRYQTHGPRTLEESRAYIAAVLVESARTPRTLFDLAVVHRGEGCLVGRCGMRVTDAAQREATLWYVLDPRRWGQGYTVEAARAVLDFGFSELGLHRFFVDVDPRNHASARVAEKLGMRREAHFVENAFLKGEWTDSVIYGLLDREWRGAGAALVERLG